MSEFDPLLRAEIESLDAPMPATRCIHLQGRKIVLRLLPEAERFVIRAAAMLDRALPELPAAQVYDDVEAGIERIDRTITLDATLRGLVSADLAALVSCMTEHGAPVEDLSAITRAVNRLRLAFLSNSDEVAAAGAVVCAVLLADLLELRPFA